jgi:RNA polymerase sigma-70 factor, ECF subfamily
MEQLGIIGGMQRHSVQTMSIFRDEGIKSHDAFERLVSEHAQTVFHVAYSVLHNAHDAEDVVQETFLKVFKRGRIHEIENPKAWLARIAWRTALDMTTNHQRAYVVDQDTAATSDSDPERTASDVQERELLYKMIATLPDELRCALVLSTVKEMNSREIGEVLKIPETSVRTRLSRARQILRDKFASVVK